MADIDLIEGEPRSRVSATLACELVRQIATHGRWFATLRNLATAYGITKAQISDNTIHKIVRKDPGKLNPHAQKLIRLAFAEVAKGRTLEQKFNMIEAAKATKPDWHKKGPFEGLLFPPFSGGGRGKSLNHFAGHYLLLRQAHSPEKNTLLTAYMAILEAEDGETPLRFTTFGYSAGNNKDARQVDGYMYKTVERVFAIGRLYDAQAGEYTDEIRFSICEPVENRDKRRALRAKSELWTSDNADDMIGIRLGLNRGNFRPRGYYVWAYRLAAPLDPEEFENYVFDFSLDGGTEEDMRRLAQLKAFVLGFDDIVNWLQKEPPGDMARPFD